MSISASKDLLVFPNDNSGRVYVNETIFTANGTWSAPVGVTSAQVILVGAGGGGGGGSAAVAGGGGGAGAVVVKNLTVTPGTSYTITIGAGGQGGQGSLTSATDVLSTLPGGNGGTTSFGTITIGNLLYNAYFDYGNVSWDNVVFYRAITGVNGQSLVTAFPNVNGIVAGMYVNAYTTMAGLPANVQVASVSGNTINLTAALTAAVNGIAAFDINDNTTKNSNIIYNNISTPTFDAKTGTNPQTTGGPTSPWFYNLSNNLLQPQVAQFEDPTIVTNGYVRVYGTNPATIQITNSGLPTKLTEMGVPFTVTASGVTTSQSLTVATTANLAVGMYVTGANIQTGTVINSIDSTTSLTISNVPTGNFTAQSVGFSYSGSSLGQYALQVVTGSSVAAANPTWVNTSSLNNTSNTTGSTSVAGFSGIPYVPGQTYTLSVYVNPNTVVSTGTPILLQIRSTGASYMAQSNVNYLGGTTTGTTNSIDAGTSNGFFVRQITPTLMAGYGGATTGVANAASGVTTITLDSTSWGQVFAGMTVAGAGIPGSTVISSVGGSNTIVISNATSAPLSNTTLTFGVPTNTQIFANRWQRITATFTTPGFGATTQNSVYGYGSTPQFIYPTLVFEQPNTIFWIDNMQLELGNSTTSWLPPLYATDTSLVIQNTTSATTGNMEASHKFVKAIAGTTYAGSAFVLESGTTQQYRPVAGFIEFYDADYNSLGRTNGTGYALPSIGVASGTQWSATLPVPTTHPIRVGVTATAPVNTAYAKFGVTALNAAQQASAGVVEFHVIYPQLETTTYTTVHRNNDGSYVFAGQAGNSVLISIAGTYVQAEGGGGGGTYNSQIPVWQYGLEGANNGGHAANGGYSTPTAAGGGAGSFQAGGNALTYMPNPTNSTTFNFSGTSAITGAYALPTFPLRGNYGGNAVTNTGTSAANIPTYAGDGGLGQTISSLNSGSTNGIAIAGGGGGAGWMNSSSATAITSGRGNAGGGRGGSVYLVNQANLGPDYYARGIDAVQNTGSGGGGGGSNQNNSPLTPVNHSHTAVVTYETANSAIYQWSPLYNSSIQVVAGSLIYGTNVNRVTIQDVGDAKIVTSWSEIPVLPRTQLYFPGVAAILRTAPAGVTSTQFPGQAKQVRPTVRWKTTDGKIIREDRPYANIIFSALTTTTYLGPVGATVGAWQTLLAPANAAYFDVTWEFLYFDGGDQIDVDFNGLQYYPNISNGGNGADGLAIVRWFDKATF